MDHKTWLWKRKPTEKTTVAAEKVNISLKGNEEETLLTDKAEFEREMKILNEKLSSALSECKAKDDLVGNHAKMEQEALTGWEKAEAEAVSLKLELDEVLRQRVAAEERLAHLDMALKECMQQLRFVREEQEQRIHDAVMKTSKEFEKIRLMLEEKLADTNRRVAKLAAENTQLSKTLLAKEKLIEDISQQRTRAETDFKALMSRLESTEKENASLKYEVRVLEKELEIRNEEREFNHRTADVAHMQHLESVKKIAKLESECQRLRLLVRKRLPGPAAVAKMKSEVELLARDRAEMRRKSNLTGSVDFAIDYAPDTPSKRISYLTEQLCAMEEENKSLKETLNKKANELQLNRIMQARVASRLSQVEVRLEESSIGQIATEPAGSMPMPHELSLAMSDIGSDDKVSCAESWASALISELEHVGSGRQMGTTSSRKSVGASEIDLMDDFVEMEKLAVESMDKQFESSHLASVGKSEIVGPLGTQSGGDSSAAAGRKIVAVNDSGLGLRMQNHNIQPKNMLVGKFPSWLQDILKVVLQQNQFTKREPDEILEDIRFSLQYINDTNSSEFVDAKESSNQFTESNRSAVSGCISWKPPGNSPLMSLSTKIIDDEISSEKKSNHQVQSNLSKSICKTIKLIEMSLSSLDYGASEIVTAKDGNFFPYKNSETPSGYMVRVFQWKTSELSAVLQKFIQTCNDLLIGKADLEKFSEEVTSALDWVMNHCFSLQDVSSMRDAIKKQFDWDESLSENEVESGTISQFSGADKLETHTEKLSYSPIVSASNDLKIKNSQPRVREESKKLEDKWANLESVKKELKGRLQSQFDRSESLMIQLHESERPIKTLHTELEASKQSKGEIENLEFVNADLEAQPTVTRVELNEVHQNFSSLETKLENKSNCCEELEVTCFDQQLQLESVKKKEIPKHEMDGEEKQLRTDWEVTAASEKLAECQETILNLGRQLKALASPGDAAFLDKLVSNHVDNTNTTSAPKKSNSQRSSLLDKMLADDNTDAGDFKFPKAKEVICISDSQELPALLDSDSAFHSNGTDPRERFIPINDCKYNDNEAVGNPLAIVPAKKKGGGGLLKKLLWRRTKGNSKKLALPLAA